MVMEDVITVNTLILSQINVIDIDIGTLALEVHHSKTQVIEVWINEELTG